jgi:hypothetical protein
MTTYHSFTITFNSLFSQVTKILEIGTYSKNPFSKYLKYFKIPWHQIHHFYISNLHRESVQQTEYGYQCHLVYKIEYDLLFSQLQSNNPMPLCRTWEETGKTEAPCHSRCGTIKILPCSKVLGDQHRSKFCSGDVSIWVKNSRAGRKTVNNQSIHAFGFHFCHLYAS